MEKLQARVRKAKSGKAAGKDEITGEMIKGRGDKVGDWIWKLCNVMWSKGVSDYGECV